MQYPDSLPSQGILERLTPPTLRAIYLFWLMQATQGEIDPSFLNDCIRAGGGVVQRATLNAMELETFLTVHVALSKMRHLITRHRLHPAHGALLRSLCDAERMFARQEHAQHPSRRYQHIGGIGLTAAKTDMRRQARLPR